MFSTLRRWLRGEETKSDVVRLQDIPTWTQLYGENIEDFADTLSGIDESPKYAEDPEINEKVSIYGADMTLLQVDGIVRSTDASLTSQEGISGAINTAAGPKLDEVLKTLGGCNPGEAKTTSGFNLPANYIVHTVGTNQEQPEILERCYKSCLEQMRLQNMKSLAFCCISTGTNGYPNDKAVHVALTTVRIWLEKMKTENKLDEIDRIIFCLFSDVDVMLYSIWMQIHFPSTFESKTSSTVTQAASPEKDAGSINQQKTLRPLPGFIELTDEPDMITLDDDPNTMRAKMPCGHVIGSESMRELFRDIVDKGKFSIMCPAHDCNQVWEYFLVRHVACLSDEEMQELESKQEENFLQRQKVNQMCPGCKTWCMRAEGGGNRVRCPICTAKRGKKFYFCWVCLNEWKRFRKSGPCGNSDCGKGKGQRILKLATCPTKMISLCLGCPSIRACPSCDILIEHQDKCAHMSCSHCQCKFCFICLQEFKDGKWQCNFLGTTCSPAPRQVP